jgi:hypothetical protein
VAVTLSTGTGGGVVGGALGAGRTFAKTIMITRTTIAPKKNPPIHAPKELVDAGTGGAAAAIYYNRMKISATHEDRASLGQISATHLL